MRGSTSTLKEYTVEESLKIFREAGFTKLEMARGHLVLCKTHELHIEMLTNLDKLPEEVTLISLPLKIQEGDGSPVRAVALID